ncbi:MAG: glycosyltransferase [Hyphomicrobium sp.]
MNNISVFYLARLAEGFDKFQQFADSYRQHPAGVNHELVVIAKGSSRKGEFAALAEIFKGLPHRIAVVADDIGYDIQAYRLAAATSSHEYVCFLNTFSIILADEWLRKLYDAMTLPGTGMVGATGSFESLYSSFEVVNRANWFLQNEVAFNRDIIRGIEWKASDLHRSSWKEYNSKHRRFLRAIRDIRKRRPKADFLTRVQEVEWIEAIRTNPDLSFVNHFPYFPNPHIRSNAFMLRRQDFIHAPLEDGNTKIQAMKLESGFEGLSRRFLDAGQRLLVVGANGRAYDIPDWPQSECFRSNTQSNLLVSDNQTRQFDKMSPSSRATHQMFSWGSYLPTANRASFVSVPFDDLRPLSDFAKLSGKTSSEPLISIVIPTKNRIALLLDAIETIVRQNYRNWEIVVFDNCSTEPVGKHLADLNDPRIRWERSDTSLPVTDSWNNAFDMVQGEYVTMIGDDDGLAPGFFQSVAELSERFERPDVIYSSLYQFIHPNVRPTHPLGYVQALTTASFMRRRDFPFVLDRKTALENVRNSLAFRRTFNFNMASFTVRRDFLNNMRRNGKVLKPPFPDYYFANMAFALGKKIVVEPRPLAFQGVSRASFGFTLFNDQADQGFAVLGHKLADVENFSDLEPQLLPGSEYQSQYLATMLHVAKELGEPLDFERYRSIQIFDELSRTRFDIAKLKKAAIWKRMTQKEKMRARYFCLIAGLTGKDAKRHFAKIQDRHEFHAFKPVTPILNQGDLVTNVDLYDALESGAIKPFRP